MTRMTRTTAALLAVLLLGCLVSSSLCQSAYPQPRGDPSASPLPPKPALLEMLEQSSPVLRPEREWRHPDLRAWLAKESLAAGLGLAPLRRLHVPLHVNVFAVGLEGAGALGVEVSALQLAEWMRHLEHVVPQHVISRETGGAAGGAADQTAAVPTPDDGAAQELEHTSSSRRRSSRRRAAMLEEDEEDDEAVLHGGSRVATPPSQADAARISYRYHIRLVQLSPKVVRVLERYLGVHYRVANEKHTEFQVDAEIINGLLEGLVRHLKLDDAYNVFVLNPSQEWLVVPASVPADQQVSYGYRSGFSNDELDALLEPADAAVKKFVEEWRTNAAASYTNQLERDRAAGPQPVPQFKPRVTDDNGSDDSKRAPQLQVLDHLAASDEWATSVLSAPHFTGPQPLLSYLRQQSEHHSEVLRASIGNNFAHEDCLVDAWVGRGRTLFLDLGAGPSRWGPIVGGEGVKSPSSFPSLKTFASARAAELAEEQGEDPYVDASYDADAVAAERIVLLDMLDAQCGGHGSGGEESAVGGRESSPECLSIEAKLADLSEFEAEHTHRIVGDSSATPAPGPKAPPMDSQEGLSFFHDDKPTRGGPNSGHDASIEVNHFMSHLSSTLSASLHQVLTPTVADTHQTVGGYAERVHFHLYALVNHQSYDPLGDQFVARLKYGLDQLRMPTQSFVYSVHKLTMADDPALAMAYTSALRSAVVPTLMSDGRFSAIKRLYLDSRLLQASLASINVAGKAERDPLYGQANRAASAAESASSSSSSSSSFRSPRTRDISIFLFSLDFPLPVLVDKFHQSQALPESGLVVSVQSNLRLWESALSCNGKPTYWNLRDPLRSILTSTARVLGGLLPMHVKHSSAHGRAAEDWLWSVGLSPLALTSAQGLEFSQTQRDTLHRNYVLTAMRSATQLVNRQLRLLARQRTSLSNRMLAGIDDVPLGVAEAEALNATLAPGAAAPPGRFSARARELQSAYSDFAALLTGEMTDAIEALDFERACSHIDALHRSAQRVSSLVTGVIEWNARDACSTAAQLAEEQVAAQVSGSWTPHLAPHWYLATAAVCCALVLFALFGRRNEKPKLN